MECLATAIWDDTLNRVLELNIKSKENESLLGNIYVGKVQKVATHLNAAFIDIKPNFSCYYPLDKNKNPRITSPQQRTTLKAGDELLVQVSTEALKSKIPTVTSHLNIAGELLVLTVNKGGIGLSRQLDEEARTRLKGLMTPHLRTNVGIVVRTNAALAKPEAVLQELEELHERLDNIYHLGNTRTCYSLIESAVPAYIQNLKHIKNANLTEIVTDDEETFDYLKTYLQGLQSTVTGKLRFYDDKLLPLAKLYSLESTIDNATKEKVWLKSGGFLMIQQTEAFVVIDVNSGKYQGKQSDESIGTRINLEAAKEIALELRLRNLSGIILIDFINMNNQKTQDELLETLKRLLQKDSVRAVVVDMTQLQIVEVTRKKVQKSLVEQIAGIL